MLKLNYRQLLPKPATLSARAKNVTVSPKAYPWPLRVPDTLVNGANKSPAASRARSYNTCNNAVPAPAFAFVIVK